MSKQQQTLMRFDPATGWGNPYPSHADQWREFNGEMAWLFNPWTGERRHAADVGSDTFGLLILPPGEPVYAAAGVQSVEQPADERKDADEVVELIVRDVCEIDPANPNLNDTICIDGSDLLTIVQRHVRALVEKGASQ